MTRLPSRRPDPRFRWPRRSFTVVELAVTVAILGILCGVIIDAGIREWRREQVTTALVELAGWLESVRRSAIKGYSCTVTIAPGDYVNGDVLASVSTSVSQVGPCGTVGAFRLKGLNSKPGFVVSRSGLSPSFTFTPAGTLSPAPPANDPIVISLRLKDQNPDPHRCLLLDGMLGLIDVGVDRNNSCVVNGAF